MCFQLNRGIESINLSNSVLSEKLSEGLGSCSHTCNHLWDGFGRWTNDEWKPDLQGQRPTSFYLPRKSRLEWQISKILPIMALALQIAHANN